MRSESTSALGQPRLMKPTFGLGDNLSCTDMTEPGCGKDARPRGRIAGSDHVLAGTRIIALALESTGTSYRGKLNGAEHERMDRSGNPAGTDPCLAQRAGRPIARRSGRGAGNLRGQCPYT